MSWLVALSVVDGDDSYDCPDVSQILDLHWYHKYDCCDYYNIFVFHVQ